MMTGDKHNWRLQKQTALWYSETVEPSIIIIFYFGIVDNGWI